VSNDENRRSCGESAVLPLPSSELGSSPSQSTAAAHDVESRKDEHEDGKEKSWIHGGLIGMLPSTFNEARAERSHQQRGMVKELGIGRDPFANTSRNRFPLGKESQQRIALSRT
jgi:hypothetical protein